MSLTDFVAQILGSNGSTKASVVTRGSKGALAVEVLDAAGNQVTSFADNLIPSAYDYIELTYSGSNIATATYKTGGSGGTTVATLTMTYDGSDNITSITRT